MPVKFRLPPVIFIRRTIAYGNAENIARDRRPFFNVGKIELYFFISGAVAVLSGLIFGYSCEMLLFLSGKH